MEFMFKDINDAKNRIFPVRKDKLHTDTDGTQEIFYHIPRSGELSSVTTNVGSNTKFAISILLISDQYFMIDHTSKGLFLILSNSKEQLKRDFFTRNKIMKSSTCPFRSHIAREDTSIEDVFDFLWEVSAGGYQVDSNNTHKVAWECQRRFASINYDTKLSLKENIPSEWRKSTIWVDFRAEFPIIHQIDCIEWPVSFDRTELQSLAVYDVEKTDSNMLMLKAKTKVKFYVSLQDVHGHFVILIAKNQELLAPWKAEEPELCISPLSLNFASSIQQSVVKKNTTFRDFRELLEGALPIKSPRKFLANLATALTDLKEKKPKGIPLIRAAVTTAKVKDEV